ncbi:hypothetical protein EDD76_10124 [Kineothrix alysoides]|uniref:Uncharacterized protein n=1 Tax=Kineothrix alysoides TaxID=1469948 RepID=A0A4V2QCM7_9FIRM|nr:hypothetical protein [Kineothrix alysoides]TCL60927.1 hypothetical protein EDD76_10124 [Kineothrix alysoides]
MRRRRQPTAGMLIQIGIAGILLILLVLLVVWYGDGLSSYKPDEATFQYVAGIKVEYSEDATYRNKEGMVSIREGSEENVVDSIPILYPGTRKMTLPKNMLIMTPAQGQSVKRVNYFTTLKEQDGVVTLENDKKKAKVFGGFLYDGENTYVFLEKMVLSIGKQEVQMEPLSYVRVIYRQFVEYYNSADESYEWIGIESTDIKAESETGYVIDLGKDIIDMGDGEALIYSAVDSLPVITMRK